MSLTRVSLQISHLVPSGDTASDTYVIPNGLTARVMLFEGSAPSSSLSVLRLIWRWGEGVDEESHWTIANDKPMPRYFIPEFVGDGVKKLAVCLDNGCTSDYYMSAFALVEIE